MNKLREYRIARNLTVADLAALVGVHYHTVYSWETGKSRPHLYELRRIAQLFECTEDELGIAVYDRYRRKESPKELNSEAAELYRRFEQLTLDQQRWIAAYLSPDPYRLIVKRLREGLISNDDAALIRRMMEECE